MYLDIPESVRKKERLKAKELKKSRWWQTLIQKTNCYYCEKEISRQEVTMDHIVPISRGGKSNRGNLVPCCKSCNLNKRSLTAVEWTSYLNGELNENKAEPHTPVDQ